MSINSVREKILPILKEYNITYAGIFGSVASGQVKKNSDVDIIVRFGSPIGMFAYMRFINGLERTLKKKVDVVTEQSLNKFVKPYVLPEVKVIYEK